MTKSEVDAAITGIKNLASGHLSFQTNPQVVQLLTSSPRTPAIVDSLMCVAERRGAVDAKEAAHFEYTRKLFMFMWGTSPAPGPEDVQAWTQTHPYGAPDIAAPSSARHLQFAREAFDDLQPDSDTCTKQTIPAGVPACVDMSGKWSNGSGPLGNTDSKDPRDVGYGAMSVYATEAKDHELVLTASHPYQNLSWLKQNVDYIVCVRAPAGVEQNGKIADRVVATIENRPRKDCLATGMPNAPGAPQ